MKSYLYTIAVTCFGVTDAYNDAYIPEMWANEGLAVLEENMVMANLVHRDFEAEVRNYGDVVNTRKPVPFTISRKVDGDTLVSEQAQSTNVQVPLDQWFYKSFVIKDGEASLSFQELADIYLVPAMQVIARGVDRAIMGRIHAFLGDPADRAGTLCGLTASTSQDDVLEARQILNENLAPMTGRRLVLSPASETALLKNTMFVKANERGDGGTALENATLGRILGFDTYLDQNVNCILTGADISSTAITLTEPYSAGTAAGTALACASISTEGNVGEYLIVAGNDQPTWATAIVASTSIALNEALKYATLDNAVVTRYKKCDVNAEAQTGSTYAAGYSKAILVDGHTASKGPQVGQLVSFGTTTGTRHTYTVIESTAVTTTSTNIVLDRPLTTAVANDALCFPGPYGSYNWAFHRDAIALVSRPLALPSNQLGVMTSVGIHNDVAMRVAMQYDIDAGGTKVNLDLLCGVAVLDTALCVPLLG